jgi:peptidoglycan hydrolase CwlO-like protein
VPAPTNSERIDGLTKAISAFDEHIEAIRGDLDEVKKGVDGVRSQSHQLDTQIARIEESLKPLRKDLTGRTRTSGSLVSRRD